MKTRSGNNYIWSWKLKEESDRKSQSREKMAKKVKTLGLYSTQDVIESGACVVM